MLEGMEALQHSRATQAPSETPRTITRQVRALRVAPVPRDPSSSVAAAPSRMKRIRWSASPPLPVPAPHNQRGVPFAFTRGRKRWVARMLRQDCHAGPGRALGLLKRRWKQGENLVGESLGARITTETSGQRAPLHAGAGLLDGILPMKCPHDEAASPIRPSHAGTASAPGRSRGESTIPYPVRSFWVGPRDAEHSGCQTAPSIRGRISPPETRQHHSFPMGILLPFCISSPSIIQTGVLSPRGIIQSPLPHRGSSVPTSLEEGTAPAFAIGGRGGARPLGRPNRQ